ncbi:MAG: carbohydrate ABC transporter permease [Thermomicrobiales bacterium]|nr:carbohydrate ABC transporter permease [Thermomicrobiales bacterium]
MSLPLPRDARRPNEPSSRDKITPAYLSVQALLTLAAIITLVPVVWTVLSSLKTNSTIFAVPFRWLPETLQWNNYVEAFQVAPFGRFFLNSTIVAISVTATTVFFAAMAGYGFSKFRFPGRNILFGMILSTFMIPFPVIMIPLFVLVRNFGWVNSYLGLIVPGALTGFAVFMMRQFIQAMPSELIDAARCDGAGEIRIFFTIVLPLARPALATLGILTFLDSWNNLLWPLIVIQSEEMQTIPLGLTKFSTLYSTNYSQMLAMAVIASLPVLIVFIIGRRQIINSLMLSGIKG